MWISSAISLFSLICAIGVFFLDRYLRNTYVITDQTNGKQHVGAPKKSTFRLSAIRHMPFTFWMVVFFAVFENAGVQSFVSISTYVESSGDVTFCVTNHHAFVRQFAQQRLKKGAVIGGWVSNFYLLLPACLTPFIGIYIDVFGQRIGFRMFPSLVYFRCQLTVCPVFMSGLTFLISMLLLKFSHSIPTFSKPNVMSAQRIQHTHWWTLFSRRLCLLCIVTGNYEATSYDLTHSHGCSPSV